MLSLSSRVHRGANARFYTRAFEVAAATGLAVLLCLSIPFVFSDAYAQRSGQSTTIRTGTVTGMRTVDLQDGNAVGGALVGGAFGAALSGRNSSSKDRNRAAALGAILGGAVAASKRTQGRIYTVNTIDGATIQVATEQVAMEVGDCVYIEESVGGSNSRSGGTNIRRAPAAACEPESQPILKEKDIEEELQEDADLCFKARRQLADADDDEAFDRAVRRLKLLCYE